MQIFKPTFVNKHNTKRNCSCLPCWFWSHCFHPELMAT